jgi:hypothetical protein
MNPFDQFDEPGKLPFKGNPFVDDIGVNPMDENDVNAALGGNPFDQFDAQEPIKEASAPVIKAPYQKEGLGRTIFDQGMQGATFGFADDISDRVGATMAALAKEPKALITGEFTDPQLIDEVANARNSTEDRLSKQFKDRPATSILSNIGGALFTGAAGATTRAGAAIGNASRTGSTVARVFKGIPVGAASGAFYGAGVGKDGEKTESARRGAILGGSLSAAAPVVGKVVEKALTKTVVPTSEQVRNQASKLYEVAEQKGGALSAGEANKFYNQILKIRPQTVEGKVFKGKSAIADIFDQIPDLKDRPMTLRAAQEVDEALGDLAYGTMDKFGKLTSDGKKFLDMQTSLRRTIENADESMVHGGKEGFEALKEARRHWATSLRLRDVEKIIDNSQYAEQPATALRTGFRTLLKNPDRLKGYTPKEVAAIKRAAKTGIVTDALRLAGSGLTPIIAGAGGAAATVPMGGVGAAAAIPAYLVQQAAKKAGVVRQTARAKDVAKVVASRVGLNQEPLLTLPEIMKLPPEQAKKLLAASRVAGPGAAVIQSKR